MNEISLKRLQKFYYWAKALNIPYINCPDLKVGAIEKHLVTGFLPQASLRGAQNQQFLDRTLYCD
jgi:hypothetical protein